MSEVQSRPAASRGRSTARGGRGGYRGGSRAGNKQTDGDRRDASDMDPTANQSEMPVEMKNKYSSQLSTLKEMFPDWTDLSLVLALQEADGDIQITIEKITGGHVTQFHEIKNKTKDRSRSKVKEPNVPGAETTTASSRPGRGRGTFESTRGGRSRSERGRGGHRGGRGGAAAGTNGTTSTGGPTSVPTTESSAWDATAAPAESNENAAWDTPATGEGAPDGQYGSVITSGTTPATASEGQKSSLIPGSGVTKGGWASLFAKPKPAPAPPKPATEVPPSSEAGLPPATEEPPTGHDEVSHEAAEPEAPPIPPAADEVPVQEPVEPPTSEALGTLETIPDDTSVNIPPSKDKLTEDNVEHLPDASIAPPLTETAASTAASSRDAGVLTGTSTPLLQPQQQPPIGRPPMGGYATSAYKATGTPGRSASFQRRILEQQEAVVMPGNHAVDRAAVQFGSMGLNGDPDALDVDDDREEAETRTQPPQHSPPSQPRAALPPAPRQPSPPADVSAQDTLPTPKQAPGLPPAPQQQQPLGVHQQSPPNPLAAQMMPQHGAQGANQYSQFGRYGAQPSMQTEPSVAAPKPYDPFGQQPTQQTQYDGYPSQTQAPSQHQPSAHSHIGGFSSAPNDYSSYYTSDQQRNAYQNYYNAAYGQQGAPSQQETGAHQQRTGSAFGSAPSETAYGAVQSQQAAARYGEAPTSGHATPNPPLGAQHQSSAQSQQSQHMHQQPHGQTAHGGGYPYGHPYYNSPYYTAYMNQYNYGQQGFGGPFGAKGGMYQPHHGYGMSPQTSYDQHSSSPANVSGFGQSSMHGRDTGLGGGLGDYGRSSSAQPSQSQQYSTSGGGFGGMPEVFGRSQGGFPGQSQSYGQQPGGQQAGSDDALKPFGDSKPGSGPSPSALGQPGRPASATNNTPGQGTQSGLPPPQTHQQGFGYPSHLGQMQSSQGSQYGGLGGLGGHQGGAQSHQGGGYGAYGAGFGGSYGNYGRGGWGGNYGH